ncbi:MAG TPA: transcriptional regulator, partial [Pantoea sp.]|nr:transcriptional regulator [Pantoea sp.]
MSELNLLLLDGPLSAMELMARLDVSQATLSRLVARQKEIIKYGRARATRYALLRPICQTDEWPLWRIDEAGRANAAGTLRPVWPQGSCVVKDEGGQW